MGTVCVETSGSGQSGLPGKRAKEFVGALDWARIRPGSNPVRNRARTLRVGGSSAERARLSPSGAADAKGLARAAVAPPGKGSRAPPRREPAASSLSEPLLSVDSLRLTPRATSPEK